MPRLCAFLVVSLSLLLAASTQAGAGEPTQEPPGGEPTASEDAARGLPRPPEKAAPSKSDLKPLIEGAAKRHGVELALVKAVISAESAYNAHAVSRAGAVGLMQLMPATAADYGVGDASTLFDPAVNVETGIRHLKRLLSKYKNDYGRVIMAYNAGEGVVDRTNSNVTYVETLAYTEAVIKHYRRNGGTQPTEEALRNVKRLRSMKNTGKARQLMAQYLDLSIPELKVRHNRNIRFLDPGLDSSGPESRPMMILEARGRD